jgi:hypothetical protein
MATPPHPPADRAPGWDDIARAEDVEDPRDDVHGPRADWELGPPLVALAVAAAVVAIVLVLVL